MLVKWPSVRPNRIFRKDQDKILFCYSSAKVSIEVILLNECTLFLFKNLFIEIVYRILRLFVDIKVKWLTPACFLEGDNFCNIYLTLYKRIPSLVAIFFH